MWFRTSFDAPNCSSPRRPTRRRVRSDDRREARRLFLENLEGRSLMAFDVLAEYATSQYPPDMALTQINAGGQLDWPF